MKNYKEILVGENEPLEDVIKTLDRGAVQVVFVVDKGQKLLGSVTDGDIRRSILRHRSFDTPISEVMNKSPRSASIGTDKEVLTERMIASQIKQLPLLSNDGVVEGVALLDDILNAPLIENVAFILAGGLGSRLQPLTDEVPKPMLKVGDRPILERILDQLKSFGISKAILSVNHKADIIENYFGNGSKFGLSIDYIHEKTRLGTAGALALLSKVPDMPMVVMNGDILTKVHFGNLLQYHNDNNFDITVCLKKLEYAIPYGVVEVDQNRIIDIKEKPVYKYFVSAGVYVVNPSVIEHIEKNKPMDMPDLVKKVIGSGMSVGSFPIHEYWIDIGRHSDYDRAVDEYEKHFND